MGKKEAPWQKRSKVSEFMNYRLNLNLGELYARLFKYIYKSMEML